MFDNLMTFIRNNPLPAVLVGIAVLLFLVLAVLMIVWLRRQNRAKDVSWTPQGAEFTVPQGVTSGVPASFSSAKTNVGDAPVGGFGATSGSAFGPTAAPSAGSTPYFNPGAGAGPTPYFNPDAGAGPSPFAAAPPAPAPPGGPGGAGTVVLERTSKPKHAAVLIDRKDVSRRFDLRSETDIGRTQGNALVLPDTTVSRQHARIRLQGDHFVLFDLDSANGTFVNGQSVQQPKTLTDGDIVRFGDVEMVFKQLT